MTPTNFYVGIGFFTVLTIGLAADIVLVVLFWDKLSEQFKNNLETVPWTIRDALYVCLGLVLLYGVIHSAGYYLYNFKIIGKTAVNIFGGLFMYVAGVWLVAYVLNSQYGGIYHHLKVSGRDWIKKSARGIAAYLCFIPIMILLLAIGVVLCNMFGITPESHPIVDILKKKQPWYFLTYIILVAVFVAPVFEEVLFRGIFYQIFKKRFGLPVGVILSSILFSAMHFNVAQFLPIVGLGALMCFVYESTASLVPSIVIHIANNGIFMGLFFLLKDYTGG